WSFGTERGVWWSLQQTILGRFDGVKYSSIWAATVILRKDVKTELRSRHGVSILILFGVTATTVISFVLGIPDIDEAVAAALLWVILFFLSVAGLGYSFIREEEQMTM